MAMAAMDRSDVLDKAVRLVQRGELESAVRVYAKLFEQDPTDWNIGNTLGDLWVRVGKSHEAISHFTVLAEQLASDGFAAKARALYRKILRIQPHNAAARQRVEELDRQQAGSVSPFLRRVLETARTSRDTAAAAETAQSGSRAAPEPPMPDAAPAAAAPVASSQPSAGMAAAPSAPEPSPPDAEPAMLSATPWAPAPSAPPTPPSSTSAPIPATSAEWAEEWAAVVSAPALPPERIRTPRPDPPAATPTPHSPEDHAIKFREAEAAADAAVARRDFRAAAQVIERFLAARPRHILALEKLIDIGVDGALNADGLIAAQMRLADACVSAGRYGQARDIAVDLVLRQPDVASHRDLLNRIAALAEANGLAPAAPQAEPPRVALPPSEGPAPTVVQPPAVAQASPAVVGPPSEEPESPPLAPQAPVAPAFESADETWIDCEEAFDDIRNGLLEDAAAAAEERLAEAERFMATQRFEQAIPSLQEAMCAPHLRAPAGSRLARIYRERGDAFEALTCLEWVAEIPPASEESGHELAYELALTLEAVGEHAQALGIYRELIAEVGADYRDIATRAERLTAA